jgi:MFS family permease
LTLAAGNAYWAFASGALIGLALGAEYNLMSYLSARYFGFKRYGVIYGAIFGSFCLGQAVSPPVVGKIYAATGSYRVALMILAVCFLVSAVLLQLCGSYPDWKLGRRADILPARARGG